MVDQEEYKKALKKSNSKGYSYFSNYMRSRILDADTLLEQSVAEINRDVKRILQLLESESK